MDLIELDVVVLDKDRKPVTGLTAADFTILENGRPMPISVFRAVELPGPVAAPVPWMRDVPKDVTANTTTTGRAVVVFMESPSSVGKLPPMTGRRPLGGSSREWADKKMRQAARTIIDNLGPDDIGAVVYTWGGTTLAQGFTSDRGRLLKAVPDRPPLTSILCDVCTDNACCNLDTMTLAVKSLETMAQRPKTLFFVNTGFAIVPGQNVASNQDKVVELLRAAERAHVTIQTVDPQGLTTTPGINAQTQGLRAIADGTGGRAVFNNNEPETVVPEIMSETRSYYLLGFQAAPPVSGGLHSVKVTVNRPDVDVRTRTGYYDRAGATESIKTAPPGSNMAAIEGLLAKPDIPLVSSVAPFADANKKPVLAITLGVGGTGANTFTTSLFGGRSETAQVLAELFDANGKRFGSTTLSLSVPADSSDGEIRYELLPRLPAPSRRFELRMAVKMADGRTGSVFNWVDVPDFAKAPLSMSGLIFSALPSPPVEPRTAFADLIAAVPTTRRQFGARDFVTAAARVYQGGSRPLVPVTLTTRLVNSLDKDVVAETTPLEAAAFGNTRSAAYQFRVPTNALPPGEYLLRVMAAAGKDQSTRDIRFTVR